MNSKRWLIICGFLVVGSTALAQQFEEEEDFFDPPIEQTEVAPVVKAPKVVQPPVAPKRPAVAPSKTYVPPAPVSEDTVEVAPKAEDSSEAAVDSVVPELVIRVHQQYDPATENTDHPDRQYIEVYASDNNVEPFTCVTSTGTATASITDNGLPGETTTYESAGHPNAPNGYFRIFRMEEDGVSSLFENARMPYKMSFNGGIAFHQSFDRVDGRPASHGCARLKQECAEKLFRLVQNQYGMQNVRVYVEGKVLHSSPQVLDRSFEKMDQQLWALHREHLRNGTQSTVYAPNEIWVYGRRYVKNAESKIHLPDGQYVDVSDNDSVDEDSGSREKRTRARRNSFDSVVNGVGEGVGSVFEGLGGLISAPFKSNKCLTLDGDMVKCKKLRKQGRCINDDNEEIPCSGKKKKKNSNGMY